MAIDTHEDRTPAEATADFLAELETELSERTEFSTNHRAAIIVSAAPTVAAYYLKGL